MFDQFLQRPPFETSDYLAMIRKLLPKGQIWGYFATSLDDLVYDTASPGEQWDDAITASGDDTINDSILNGESWASSPFGVFWSVIASELERLSIRSYDLVRECIPGLSVEMLPDWYEITIRGEYEAALVGDDQDSQRALAHGKIFAESQAATAAWFEDYGELLGFDITVNEDPISSTPFIDGVSRCGQRLGGRGSFSIIEITVNSSEPGANLTLMQALFDRAKPAHVVIVWL